MLEEQVLTYELVQHMGADQKAKVVIPKLIEANKPAGPVKKKLKRVVGVC